MATVEMVTVEVATPEPGVMVAGENEQFKVLGIPAHESTIGLLNAPDCGVAVIVKRPGWPVETIIEVGEAPKDRVGVGVGVGAGAGAATQAEL